MSFEWITSYMNWSDTLLLNYCFVATAVGNYVVCKTNLPLWCSGYEFWKGCYLISFLLTLSWLKSFSDSCFLVFLVWPALDLNRHMFFALLPLGICLMLVWLYYLDLHVFISLLSVMMVPWCYWRIMIWIGCILLHMAYTDSCSVPSVLTDQFLHLMLDQLRAVHLFYNEQSIFWALCMLLSHVVISFFFFRLCQVTESSGWSCVSISIELPYFHNTMLTTSFS